MPASQSHIIPYLKTTNKLQNSSTSLRNSSSWYFHSFWLHYRIGRLGGQSPAHTGSDFWLHYHIGRPGEASHQFIQVLTSVNFKFCFYHYLNTIKDLQEHGTVESQKLCRTDWLRERLWNQRNLDSRLTLRQDDRALTKGMVGVRLTPPSAVE